MSSNSSDEDESKRPREPSLDDSAANVANTDVSTESLNSEDCVAIIYSCMKKLEKEIKEFSRCVKKRKDSQIKGKRQLNFLSEAMDFMTNDFEEYEPERQEKDKIITV